MRFSSEIPLVLSRMAIRGSLKIISAEPSIPDEAPGKREIPDIPRVLPDRTPAPVPEPIRQPVEPVRTPVPLRR